MTEPADAQAPPLGDYAAIGDGRTVALVSREGSVDWLCLPDLGSPAVFGRLLDPRGGSFAVTVEGPHEIERRYVPDTNVLETTYSTPTGTVRVTDALTLPAGGLAPQRELVRLVEGVAGDAAVRWRFDPRFGYGLAATRLERRGDALVATGGADAVALLPPGARGVEVGPRGAEGRFPVRAGQREVVVAASAHGEPLVLPSRDGASTRLEATLASWREWARSRTYSGPWRNAVIRSGLALELLVFARSGAIAAAPTTSLPERIGGDRNYDYRYCWVRDSAFAMDALLGLGCSREATAFFWWLMHASQLTHPELRVLYSLDGGTRTPERVLPLAGYRDSRPVRVGNAAAPQLQLDAYGDLLDAAWLFDTKGERLDADVARRLGGLADRVCTVWREPDSGIWEIRERVDQFTEGKMKCVIALERACALAERGTIRDADPARWRSEAGKVREFVERECWSDELRAYVRAAGSGELDASVLLAGQNRYAEAGDERLSSTIDAVRERLGAGPLLYRVEELREHEGAFVACSFWLAAALAHVGRLDEAGETFEGTLAYANDVGLFSEQVDPETGELLGNFPQGLSHLALVNAAARIAEAGGR